MYPKIDHKDRKRLFAILGKLGLKEDRASIIEDHTQGRTGSVAELYDHEANSLISFLQSTVKDSADKQRKKIIYYFRAMGWETEDGAADMKRINEFCIEKGYLNKPLNSYTKAELPKLVSQVHLIYKKHLEKVQ